MMQLRSCLVVLLILFGFAHTGWAQTEAFDAIVEAEYERGEVPGLAVVVLKEGSVIYQREIGYADIEQEIPVAANTPFMIGSVTKQFTAMATLMLVEKGSIELDEKVRTYLPELTPAYDAITIRHILTHTSGIQSDFKGTSVQPYLNESLVGERLYKALDMEALVFEPGEQVQYSNTGYGLLYMIIEAVSGASYSEFMSVNIFEPLGMRNTVSREREHSDIDGLAVGYGQGRRKFREARPVLRLGGGSLVSTAEDLAKWDAALYSEQLVSHATLEQIWTPQMLNDGKPAFMGKDSQGRHYNAGMGWFIGDEANRGLVHHSGGVDGYSANIDRYRDAQLTVIAVCNIENGTAVSITGQLAAAYFEGN